MKTKLGVMVCAVLMSATFCACQQDYVKVDGLNEIWERESPERTLLETVFAKKEVRSLGLRLLQVDHKAKQPTVILEFVALFGNRDDDLDGKIIILKTYGVPKADPLDGKTNISMYEFLENDMEWVKPEEIAPPFVALRVDGLALGDEGYPLVFSVAVNVRVAGDGEPSPRLQKKMRQLEHILQAEAQRLGMIQPVPKPFWIASGGDVMLDRGASDILFREGPAGIFGQTATMLAEADLTLINLEGVVSNGGEKVQKSFNFRFVPAIAPALKTAGIDAVLHANNHVFDYGKDAFVDSLSHLAKAGLGIIGAGLDIESASDPFVYKRDDETYRVFGIASFPRERNGWDGASAAAAVELPGMLHIGNQGREKLKEKISPNDDSFDIVLFHGGVEWSNRPDAATRELYTDLINAGADLIIGSHPHIVQGFEFVNGKAVFWSLGNYVFGGMDNTDGGEEGLFIRLGYLDGRLLYLEPFALTLTHTRTDIAPPEKLARFYSLSRQLR